MDREVLYGRIPDLLRRLFTLGLGSAGLFLLLWYFGGDRVWGHIMGLAWKPLRFWMDIQFEMDSFVYRISLDDGRISELTYPINQLNLSFVEVVTLFALWPHEKAGQALKLAAWCLGLLFLYHHFSLWIQLLNIELGPEFANRQRIFWESTFTYSLVAKVAAFDKLILRYWAGIPVFGLGLFVHGYLTSRKLKSKQKKKGKRRK